MNHPVTFSYKTAQRPFFKPLYSATTGYSWTEINVEVKASEYYTPRFQSWMGILFTRLETGGQIKITIQA